MKRRLTQPQLQSISKLPGLLALMDGLFNPFTESLNGDVFDTFKMKLNDHS
jgi:hypothetical protein